MLVSSNMRKLLSFALIFTLAAPAFAWDATGHRIIAAIAYDRLTPKARARVDALIRAHPDYTTMFILNAPEEPAARARAAFIAAAVWADNIKGDRRFYDESRQDAQPTAVLPGYPDMKRHTHWHYYDTPITPDGAKKVKAPSPSALSELPRMIDEIGKAPEATAVYDLPWIEHITGDLAQPLHCVSRVLKSMPKGDAGGNGVFVNPGRNLHSLWDGAASAGRDSNLEYVNKYEADATAAHLAPARVERKPKKWIEEGAKIAQLDVYTFGLETGTRDHPVDLPAGYVEIMRRVAQERIALAGYRLAAVLNQQLR